jgi:Family of unknown function (DUF5906)
MSAVPAALDLPLHVTRFHNASATTKGDFCVSLRDTLNALRDTTAPSKKDLPWLKLARLGDQRTTQGSLRHDGNVLAVSGIEADYDGEKIPLETAQAMLAAANIAAVLYTTPSHTPAKPRWRILCPTSTPLPPTARAGLVARVNGLLGGILAPESFTLSQSYYFGKVTGADHHVVTTAEGRPIDLATELDAMAIGRPQPHRAAAPLRVDAPRPRRAGDTAEGTRYGLAALERECAAIRTAPDGQKHDTLNRAAFSIGGLAAGGALVEAPAFAALSNALAVRRADCRDYGAAEATLRRAFDDGKAHPREAPPARQRSRPDGTQLATRREGEDAEGPGAEIAAAVDELNAKFMVVNESGNAVILQPGLDPVLRRRRYDRLSPRDLGILYQNRKIQVGLDEKGKPVFRTASELWLNSPDRRQFIEGVTFDPSRAGAEPGVLNLWEGFAVEPRPDDWSLMREHIFRIICGGDTALFEYLLGWMARMVQRPAEQGEVAVVMRGGEGTGKGTVAKALLRIMGQHGIAISNAKHLVGNFNAHLRDAILLFADEAFFAGDRQHVGTLKSLITEPYLTIEAKFANAVQQPNFLHVIMASNEEWVVPASLDARRFFVLNVSDAVKGDHDYFARLHAQMEAGGYEAMLHDLLNYDLRHFNIRAVPQTEGLQQQRALSLPTTEAWWKECLERGYVLRSRHGLDAYFGEWHSVVTLEVLFESYTQFATARHERHPLSREHLGRFLRRMGCAGSRPQHGVAGEHLTDEPTAFGSRRVAKLIERPRPPSYSLGDLDAARAAFTRATGLAIEWSGQPSG